MDGAILDEIDIGELTIVRPSTKTLAPDFGALIDAARKGFEHITKPRCMSCGAPLLDDPVESRWSVTTTEGIEIAGGKKLVWTCARCDMTTTYIGSSE